VCVWTLRAVDSSKRRSINRKWMKRNSITSLKVYWPWENSVWRDQIFYKLFSKHWKGDGEKNNFIVYFHYWWDSLHESKICSTIYFSFHILHKNYLRLNYFPYACHFISVLVDTKCLSHEQLTCIFFLSCQTNQNKWSLTLQLDINEIHVLL
jgi:hypothetical protein